MQNGTFIATYTLSAHASGTVFVLTSCFHVNSPLGLRLATSGLWFGQEQDNITRTGLGSVL